VERSNPQVSRVVGDQLCEARFHLAGGFIGERYGENAPWSDTKFTYEMRDTMRENARLSAAGSRKNKNRAIRMSDSSGLNVAKDFGFEEHY
jgi:hypothetical protein